MSNKIEQKNVSYNSIAKSISEDGFKIYSNNFFWLKNQSGSIPVMDVLHDTPLGLGVSIFNLMLSTSKDGATAYTLMALPNVSFDEETREIEFYKDDFNCNIFDYGIDSFFDGGYSLFEDKVKGVTCKRIKMFVPPEYIYLKEYTNGKEFLLFFLIPSSYLFPDQIKKEEKLDLTYGKKIYSNEECENRFSQPFIVGFNQNRFRSIPMGRPFECTNPKKTFNTQRGLLSKISFYEDYGFEFSFFDKDSQNDLHSICSAFRPSRGFYNEKYEPSITLAAYMAANTYNYFVDEGTVEKSENNATKPTSFGLLDITEKKINESNLMGNIQFLVGILDCFTSNEKMANLFERGCQNYIENSLPEIIKNYLENKKDYFTLTNIGVELKKLTTSLQRNGKQHPLMEDKNVRIFESKIDQGLKSSVSRLNSKVQKEIDFWMDLKFEMDFYQKSDDVTSAKVSNLDFFNKIWDSYSSVQNTYTESNTGYYDGGSIWGKC